MHNQTIIIIFISLYRKCYSKEDIDNAVKELKRGGTLRKVAKKYSIPPSTLQDYKKNKYSHQPHPNRALTCADESALVAYITWMGEHGFPITKAVALLLAFEIVKAAGRTTTKVNMSKGLSGMWWHRFRLRHPELSLRTPDPLDRRRAFGATKEAVDGLFSLIEPLYAKYGLGDKPHLIFNCDETGLNQIRAKEKVICRKGQSHAYSQKNFLTDYVTVHYCVSASGQIIPPFIIFSKRLPSQSFLAEGPKDALYGVSEKGHMDGELFSMWLKHFVKHAPAERPLLLFMDQHETHVSKASVDICRAHGVEMVCLPAKTSHLLQPLDVAVFAPLKTAFSQLASRMGLVRGDLVVGKSHLPAVLKSAQLKAVTLSNIKSGFRKTGLFPLNRMAVDSSKVCK